LNYSIINTQFMAPLLGNWRYHGNGFVPYLLGGGGRSHVSLRLRNDLYCVGWVDKLYSITHSDVIPWVNRTTTYWVKAYFSYMCPSDLDLFPKNWVTWPRDLDECICLFGCLQTFSFLKYSIINTDLVAPLLGNRRCHGNHFVPTRWGGDRPRGSFQV